MASFDVEMDESHRENRRYNIMPTGNVNPSTSLFSLIIQEIMRAAALLDLETFQKLTTACAAIPSSSVTTGTLILAEDTSIQGAPFKVVRWLPTPQVGDYMLVSPSDVTLNDWGYTHNEPFPYYSNFIDKYIAYLNVGANYQLLLPMYVDSTLISTLNGKVFNQVLSENGILDIVRTKGHEFKQYYCCNFSEDLEPENQNFSYQRVMPYPYMIPDNLRSSKHGRYFIEVNQFSEEMSNSGTPEVTKHRVYFSSNVTSAPEEATCLLSASLTGSSFTVSGIDSSYDISSEGTSTVASNNTLTLTTNTIQLYGGWLSDAGEEYRSAVLLNRTVNINYNDARTLNFNPGDAKTAFVNTPAN